jgi:uncharacterized membrane protein
MVGQVIAGAVAPVVVQSATDDEGIINRLFKIGVLIGILVLAVISIVILSWVLEIADLLGSAGSVLSGVLQFATFGGFGAGGTVIGLLGTFALSAFGFGRR